MSSETTSNTVHLLSQKSRRLNRDTFIFSPHNIVRLLAGNNQRLTHITPNTLSRWLLLVVRRIKPFELRPIALAKVGVLRYVAKSTGPAVAPDALLPPGDYGWYKLDGDTGIPFPKKGSSPFDVLRQIITERGEINGLYRNLDMYDFPPSFEQSVFARDGRCFVTGADTDVGMSWIFPPPWAHQVVNWSEPSRFNYAPYIDVSNTAVMRKDLIALFHHNAFGIDVDDEYRIVIFSDIGDVKLPTKLPRSKGDQIGPEDRFLKDHFCWCIKANLLAGDIDDDFPLHNILDYMKSLGLEGDEEDVVEPEDERWQTELGQEIWEDYMQAKLYSKRSEESEESE